MNQRLVEEIENKIQNTVNGVHTALPGTIQSFDPSTCKAVVQPIGCFKTPAGEEMAYPAISDVPVIIPQTSNIVIAFPVRSGDGCLLVFSEQELDYFMHGGSSSELHHDLTNAIAIPGLFKSSNDAIKKANDENAIVLKNNNSFLSMQKEKICIETPVIEIKGNLRIDGAMEASGSGTCKSINTEQLKADNAEIEACNVAGIDVGQHIHTDSEGGSTSIMK